VTDTLLTDGPDATGRQRSWLTPSFFREYAIIGAFVVLFILLSATSDVFLTQRNLLNLAGQQAPVAILAFAFTWLLINGEFDLSAGSLVVLSGVLAANLHDDFGSWPGFFIGIGVATACGVFNGWLVAYVRVNSFVSTLATGIIFYGIQLVITKGRLVTITGDESFKTLGQQEFLGIYWSVWIMLLSGIAVSFVLSRTKLGRRVFAVGGNPVAARLSGINVQAVKLLSFTVIGLAAGIAGAILTSRTNTGQPDQGTTHVFSAFSAVVVGGTSIGGGRGAVWRTVLGVFFLAMITNGFNLLNISIYYQQVIQGLIILLAVAVDALSTSKE
jgi:ribose transport system permease protein